jgi:iron complex outermembrane receptor protein
LGALALDYRGERLRLTLDAFHVQEKRHGGAAMTVLLRGAGGANGLSSMPAPPDSRTNVMPGYSHKNAAKAVILGGEYDFNDRWTGYAKLGAQRYESPGFMGTSVQNLQANGAGP